MECNGRLPVRRLGAALCTIVLQTQCKRFLLTLYIFESPPTIIWSFYRLFVIFCWRNGCNSEYILAMLNQLIKYICYRCTYIYIYIYMQRRVIPISHVTCISCSGAKSKVTLETRPVKILAVDKFLA